MWRSVALQLASRFTVVATDLRGYGKSGRPAGDTEHQQYSMGTLARDQIETMSALGFSRFSVAGHDRGARCAYRMAIDVPDRVDRLAVLDIVPTSDAFDRADMRFSLGFWIWSFMAAPNPIPEILIARAPDVFVDHMLDSWAGPDFQVSTDARDDYIAQFSDPRRIHAICEQYRAAATIDVQADRRDKERIPISCPTLVLWSGMGAVAEWYEPLAIWEEWARSVEGRSMASGHFIVEELPGKPWPNSSRSSPPWPDENAPRPRWSPCCLSGQVHSASHCFARNDCIRIAVSLVVVPC